MISYKHLKALFICVFIITLSSCSEENMDPDPPASDLVEEELQGLIDSRIGPDKLVGVSVSIRKNGVEQWNLVSGASNEGTPVSKEMKFGIASITKTAVAAAVLKLREEGKVSLEDPISKFLEINNENIATIRVVVVFIGILGLSRL